MKDSVEKSRRVDFAEHGHIFIVPSFDDDIYKKIGAYKTLFSKQSASDGPSSFYSESSRWEFYKNFLTCSIDSL